MERKYYEMLEKVRTLNQKFRKVNISDIGCYEIKKDELIKVYTYATTPLDHMTLFFKPIVGNVFLSRTYIYYNFILMHSHIKELLLLIETAFCLQSSNKDVLWVLNALLDYYENYLIICWYALWENCIENESTQEPLYRFCEKIKKEIEYIISIHLQLYFDETTFDENAGKKIYKQIELINQAISFIGGIENLSFRTFREFDNRIKCCNEIVYDLYSIKADGFCVDYFMMPLYGASLLAMYSKPLMNYFKIGSEIECLFVRIGFHDLSSLNLSMDSISQNQEKIVPRILFDAFPDILRDKLTLVVDDNFGYGFTTKYCKKMIEQYGGKCLVRTAETSWIKIESGVELIVDYPSIHNYLRYNRQGEYIERLKKATCYCRQLEYNLESKIITSKQLLSIKLNKMQFKRLNREYNIKKKYDMMDVSRIHGNVINRVNIDILDGKCTADASLNIECEINQCLDDGLQVSIIDLNKSLYGQTSNDLRGYLKKFCRKIWVAGGIKNMKEIDSFFDLGARGVIVGSLLYQRSIFDITMAKKIIDWFGTENIVFSVDYIGEKIVVKGFRNETCFLVDDILSQLNSLENRINVILTDVKASIDRSEVDFQKINIKKDKFSNISFSYGGNISKWSQVMYFNANGIGTIFGKNYLRNKLQLGGNYE